MEDQESGFWVLKSGSCLSSSALGKHLHCRVLFSICDHSLGSSNGSRSLACELIQLRTRMAYTQCVQIPLAAPAHTWGKQSQEQLKRGPDLQCSQYSSLVGSLCQPCEVDSIANRSPERLANLSRIVQELRLKHSSPIAL